MCLEERFVHGGVQKDFGVGLFQGTLHLRDEHAVLMLVWGVGSHEPLTAELIRSFCEGDVMAAASQVRGSLDASDPAADDEDVLWRFRLRHGLVFALTAKAWVDGAGHLCWHDLGVLIVIEAVEAADAADDVGFFAACRFFQPEWVAEQRTAEDDEISDALFDDLFGESRLPKFAHGDDLGRGGFAHSLGEWQEITVLVVIADRDVLHVFLGAGGDLDGIDIRFDQLGHFDAFFEFQPLLEEIVHAEADVDRIILAAFFLDVLQHLDQEAGAVFRRAAVFVGAAVAVWRDEHADQLACAGVDRNGVEIGFFAAKGRITEPFDELMDLFDCERAGAACLKAEFHRRWPDHFRACLGAGAAGVEL